MKLLTDVEKIFADYDLKPIILPKGVKNIYHYNDSNPADCTLLYNPIVTDGYLNKKYREYIPHGWYGFDIGTPIIPAWMEIIDKIVELCVENDPDLEIHQIKLKFGEICFYVYSNVIEDILDVEILILHKLFDRALIY
jgi:hypothetical protein